MNSSIKIGVIAIVVFAIVGLTMKAVKLFNLDGAGLYIEPTPVTTYIDSLINSDLKPYSLTGIGRGADGSCQEKDTILSIIDTERSVVLANGRAKISEDDGQLLTRKLLLCYLPKLTAYADNVFQSKWDDAFAQDIKAEADLLVRLSEGNGLGGNKDVEMLKKYQGYVLDYNDALRQAHRYFYGDVEDTKMYVGILQRYKTQHPLYNNEALVAELNGAIRDAKNNAAQRIIVMGQKVIRRYENNYYNSYYYGFLEDFKTVKAEYNSFVQSEWGVPYALGSMMSKLEEVDRDAEAFYSSLRSQQAVSQNRASNSKSRVYYPNNYNSSRFVRIDKVEFTDRCTVLTCKYLKFQKTKISREAYLLAGSDYYKLVKAEGVTFEEGIVDDCKLYFEPIHGTPSYIDLLRCGWDWDVLNINLEP